MTFGNFQIQIVIFKKKFKSSHHEQRQEFVRLLIPLTDVRINSWVKIS